MSEPLMNCRKRRDVIETWRGGKKRTEMTEWKDFIPSQVGDFFPVCGG